MNYLSYSLFGADYRYCMGAIYNVQMAKEFYPGWVCKVFYDKSVPTQFVTRLTEMGAEVVDCTGNGIHGTQWRFLINDDPKCKRYAVRDADSRPSKREKAAVDEWIVSGKEFHIMRDHPNHHMKILAGMWGAVTGVIPDMKSLLTDYYQSVEWRAPDEPFLWEKIWPMTVNRSIEHGLYQKQLYPDSKPFPIPREGKRFVGEVIFADGSPREGDWQSIDPNIN